MDGDTIIYVIIGSFGVGIFGLIIYSVAQTGVDMSVVFTAIQITFIVLALIAGGALQLKDVEKAQAVIFNIATAVMLYLPISLAMFSIIGAAIFENANFLIPVIAAGGAVGMNLALDAIGSKYGNTMLSYVPFLRKKA